MGFLHPLLLAGLAAVAIPILIHLLLRQRPRPRPWAAMRWLLAAAQQASRRYKLTNLLLLLLRMLVVALLALAVSRPLFGTHGGGERLVIIIDRSASMGPRGASGSLGEDPGPLAAAMAVLGKRELPYQRLVIVGVDAGVTVLADGDESRARAALAALTTTTVPGGLDRAARSPLMEKVLSALGNQRPDVLLVSDFQQDQGAMLATALTPHAQRVVRWTPMAPTAADANATMLGNGPATDLLPGQSGELTVLIAGQATGITLATDDAPAVVIPAVGLTGAADPSGVHTVTVPLPPLPPGDHLLHIVVTDLGLAYDNRLELPVLVRPAIPALVIGNAAGNDYLTAALMSDERAIAARSVRPALVGSEALAPGSLVALRARLPSATDAGRLAAWVREGGVLWAPANLVLDDPALAPLVAGVALSGQRNGGAWNTGSTADHDLDALLSLAGRERMPQVTLPGDAEIVLRAGEAPAVVALPVGRGWVMLELTELAGDPAWQARGATPLWALRLARRYTARAAAVPRWIAGASAVESGTIKRGSEAVAITAGEPLLVTPGTWTTSDGRRLVILPDRDEGRLDRAIAPGIMGPGPDTLAPALAQAAGVDIGMWLMLAALAIALTEGLVAAWAGKAYGR